MQKTFLMTLTVYRQVLWALLLSCGLVCSAGAAEPTILIVASESGGSYLEAIQALEDGLVRSGLGRADFQTFAISDPALYPAAASAKLLITVGLKASSLMAAKERKTPLIATLLPRTGFEQIAETAQRKVGTTFSGVWIDQPFSRQLDLVRMALPMARRIGVMWGADAPEQLPRLQSAAQGLGVQLVTAQVGAGESVFPALARILEEADVLLAVANPQIYNSSSIQNILLASYRSKVPLVGFSPGYVQAGAVFSLYSTPAMIGRQTAVMARGFLHGKSLPATPQYPHEFEVGVNTQVARSLGLSLNALTLTDRLRQMEPGP